MGYLIGAVIEMVRDGNYLVQLKKAQGNYSTKNVVVDALFSVDIPTFLSPAYMKEETSSLHYTSVSLFLKYTVNESPKSDAIAYVRNVELRQFPPLLKGQDLVSKIAVVTLGKHFDLDLVKVEKCTETKINGLNAIIVHASQEQTFFHGAIHGIFSVVEGKDKVYIISITSNPPSVFKLADKLEKSIYSFREL